MQRPAVRSVALAESQGGMGGGGQLTIDGQKRMMPSFTEFLQVDERYFATIGLSVARGRDFSGSDVSGTPPVAIVSESLGRFIAGGGDPIGHHVAQFFHRAGEPPDAIEIVGVVPDVITQVATLEPFMLYLPLAQGTAGTSRSLIVRARNRADAAAADVLGVIRQLDPKLTPGRILTMDERLLQQMAPQRFGVIVLSALGVIAVLLTVLGTAVLSESMAVLRTREMGIRAALGASRSQLGGLVVVETARLVGAGILLGLALSWLSADTIRAFLFQVGPFDPLALGGATAAIFILALAVSLRPALSLSRLDLARVLREG